MHTGMQYALEALWICHMPAHRAACAALLGMLCGHKAYNAGYSDHCSVLIVV